MKKDKIRALKILFISGILSILFFIILSAFMAPIPAFRFAVESNLNTLVRFYLILGVDPNADYTFSPVYTAVINNNPGLVKILLDSGIDVGNGTSLYIRAFEKRNKKMAKTLFKCGVPFNSRYSPMIRFAIEANDTESIDRIIEHGVPLEKAMKTAIEQGNVYAIEKLKDAGAHPDLSCLTKNATMRVYGKLVEFGEDRHRLLQKAVGFGNAKAVKYLIEEIGDDIDTDSDFYYQLAYSGIEHDQIEIVNILISRIDDINRVFTPEFVKHILSISYIIEPPSTIFYGSLLHQAVRLENFKAVKLLLDHGADPNIRNSSVNGRLKMYQTWAFKNVPLLKIFVSFFKKEIGVFRGAKRPLRLGNLISVFLLICFPASGLVCPDSSSYDSCFL